MSSYPSPEPSLVMNINNFSGVNWATHSSRIENNEAELMENFYIKENGVLSKRRGILSVFGFGNTDSVLNITEYQGNLMVGTKNFIYKVTKTEKPEVIHTYDILVQPTFINMFVLNGKLYILDGIKFKEYNGNVVKNVDSEPYVPTLFITCNPSGAGVAYEQWNMLGRRYKQLYSSDGTSKDYLTCLGETDVLEVLVDNAPVTNFTQSIDINTGKTKITFATAPAKGTDNIVITCEIRTTGIIYKDKILPNISRINKSSIYSFYGGENDTRLLLAGQDSVFYRSDVYNPYYFPENYYQSVGDTEEKIMGFVTQYDYCVILKERSVWNTRFELLDSGISTYITKPLNSQFGCINKNTVQLVNNSPLFLSKKGLAMVNQTQVRDERNISIVSERIHGLNGLLKEDLSKAVTVDYDNKYILAIGNKMYIYDYLYDCFYVWKINNELINITCFTLLNGDLHFGTDLGHVYKYRNSYEISNSPSGATMYQDEVKFGDIITLTTIIAKWKSKLFSFDDFNRYKLIQNLFITISPSESTSADISYVTNDNTEVIVGNTSNNLCTYDRVDYSKYSYLSTFYPVVDNLKIKLKKVVFFQLIITNSADDESLDIYNLGVKFKVQKEVKA